jgi:4-hydroxybutyryl-CoA dehydratase/vinylacetyl-CoA-Delta-isomerase
MNFAAIDDRLAEEEEHRELAVCTDPRTGEPYSRFYRIPETAEDLLKRRELIAAGARVNGGPPLIKEIGTDALFALHIVPDHMDKRLGTSVLPKVRDYFGTCRSRDLGFPVRRHREIVPEGLRGHGSARLWFQVEKPAAGGKGELP